jgi:hypothetical protein
MRGLVKFARMALRDTVESRLRQFREERAVATDEAALDDLERREVEFLLQAMPFIRKMDERSDPVDAKPVGKLGKLAKVTKKVQNKTLLSDFMFEIDGVELDGVDKNPNEGRDAFSCAACGGGMIRDVREGIVTCEDCGQVARDDFDLSYNNLTFDQKSSYTITKQPEYKKINHFSDHLTKLQARETKEIPEEVYAKLRAELKKNRVVNGSDITPMKIRQYLRKLGLSGYYENMYKIADHLGGMPAPKFPPGLEAKLKHMFLQAQAPFEQSKPRGRANFLSYEYTIYKFCELLGEDEYLPYLRLLKSSVKLQAMDDTWQKMCALLRWQFIPSKRM